MSRFTLFVLFGCTWCVHANAQTIAAIEVSPQPRAVGVETPVSIDLDEITYLADSSLTLVEVRGDERGPVAFQIRQGPPRTLHWIIGSDARGGSYELIRTDSAPTNGLMTNTVDDGLLTVRAGDVPLLSYQFETMAAPDSADPAYARSGFIHPLRTPGGKMLTRVQPPDHFHHYGVWNPWTHTEFEGEVIDFWNLDERQGTVRFGGFASMSEGPVFSEFQVLHEHVVLSGEAEEIALNELQTVRVYRPAEGGRYLVDLVSVLSCAGESPLRLLEYRYGGLGWRGPEAWTNANSEMLTSEGMTRANADGSLARWLLVQGEVGGGSAGAVVMSFPTNFNHPEPLRVWPEDMYDRGDVFVNFSPTKNMDWLLVPGERYVLRYRFVVFDGTLGAPQAESAWQAFAHPPEILVEPANE